MLHPGLLPLVTSVNADAPFALYKNGFKNPSGGLPCCASKSFSSAMMLATIGVDALVPATRPNCPWSAITTFSPCAEMSGNPRPLRLKRPAFVLPSAVRYCDTAAAWYDGVGKTFEKPPLEKLAATSGAMPLVAPTEVRLGARAVSMSARRERERGRWAYKGQPDGKLGTKVVHCWDWVPDTPPSPEENKMDVPRAPSCAYALQRFLKHAEVSKRRGVDADWRRRTSQGSWRFRPRSRRSSSRGQSAACRTLWQN